MGFHDPLDDAAQQNLIAESPMWCVDEIETPTLLKCGRQAAYEECEKFYLALRAQGVPSAYFVYDEGHAFKGAQAQYYDALRTLHFIDYWMKRANNRSGC